jgi:hypothetical protein
LVRNREPYLSLPIIEFIVFFQKVKSNICILKKCISRKSNSLLDKDGIRYLGYRGVEAAIFPTLGGTAPFVTKKVATGAQVGTHVAKDTLVGEKVLTDVVTG